MTWHQLVEHLVRQRRFGIEPGLDRIAAALEREGQPADSYGVINVAGTNGKGTVASLIATILQQQGERVGLYTSPHLVDLRERFRVDGQPMSVRELEPLLTRVLKRYTADNSELRLTFFELTTLMAALAFRTADVDWAIFEVGLGGRLDAVNAIEPDVSVITTIGTDHTEYLGDSIEEIAGEKAGILRAETPAIIGPQEHGAALQQLRVEAEQIGAIEDEPASIEEGEDGGDAGVLEKHRRTARRAAEAALQKKLSDPDVAQAYERWRWPGRFDEYRPDDGGNGLFMDAAHNADGLRALRRALNRRVAPVTGVVWGGMSDKDPGDTLQFFESLDVPVWGAIVDNPRSRTPEELRQCVPARLWEGAWPVGDALMRARQTATEDVLVFGSVYLLGEVYDALGVDAASLVTWRGDCDPGEGV